MTTTKTKYHVSAFDIRAMLPHRYLKDLTVRVNRDERNKEYVSKRTVEAVMQEDREDYYYILEIALDWANEIQTEKENLAKKFEKISKKSA